MSFTWGLGSLSHDLSIVDGKLVTVTGTAEVAQRVLVTLQHHWQEYFLNVPAGVPWYELILGSKDQYQVEAILRQIILGVPGVESIVRFETVFTGRNMSMTVKLGVQGTTVEVSFTTDVLQ